MKHLEKIFAIAILLFAIGFNLWTYRTEPTAKTDPNDNTFQYALVDRTNQIWDFATKNCSSKFGSWDLRFVICHQSYLVDHWVPNWAQGYNLPYYYSHIPQIMIVASWRLLQQLTINNSQLTISLFSYYHYIIYLLLCLFPLSLFLALRIVGLSWITAGVGALIASHLSTDGLYGLDPASFLWRGYGLSSQLFAMIWLPMALAYAWRYFNENPKHEALNSKQALNSKFTNKKLFRISDLGFRVFPAIPAILALTATTAGHLGIGIIAFISVGVMAVSSIFFSLSNLGNLRRLFILYDGVLLLLGYWIIPILLGGNFHNISVWDPIWKFDSYGYREVLKNLFNGDLFDFGRFPTLTILVFIGVFGAVSRKIFADRLSSLAIQHGQQENLASSGSRKFFDEQQRDYSSFSILFLFWLLFYFGRTTWGGLINLIPSMEEFHLSRFIVGLHITGLFLITISIEWIIHNISSSLKHFRIFPHWIIGVLGYSFIGILLLAVYPQTLRYSSHNDRLINQANTNFEKIEPDVTLLLSTINNLQLTNPGRVYAGRGGSWGKDFSVAETPMYMYISTFGIPTLMWLPETWSPNSDTEQYFSEDVAAHYLLYNIKYVVTPVDLSKDKIQPFWKPLTAGKTWRLYSIVIPDLTRFAESRRVGDPVYNTLDSRVRENDNNSGYISTGIRPAIVSTTKQNFTNVVRLWIQSDIHTKKLYPELTFDTNYPKNIGLPNFRMLDEVTYRVPDGSQHNLFAEAPIYQSPITKSQYPTILSQSNENDMIFKATVEVPEGCTECIVILHQTYHPSWMATIDGKPAQTMIVFPFYTAVKLENAGTHEVIFSYQPSGLKIVLLFISFATLMSIVWLACLRRQARPNNPRDQP